MSVTVRTLLIIASIFTVVFISRKLKKSQMQVADALYWIFLAAVLLLISIFPEIIYALTELVGIQSPVNLVFLVIIFLILIRCFMLSVRVSSLEYRLNELIEELGVRENLKKNDKS